LAVFAKDLTSKFQVLTPNEYEAGTYHERGGERSYRYLRDYVFPQVQKFNKTLRAVEDSEPTDVSPEQKENMAVAIFLNKTKQMDYNFKDFDAMQWRLFPSSKILSKLPKFNLPSSGCVEDKEAPTPQFLF